MEMGKKESTVNSNVVTYLGCQYNVTALDFCFYCAQRSVVLEISFLTS